MYYTYILNNIHMAIWSFFGLSSKKVKPKPGLNVGLQVPAFGSGCPCTCLNETHSKHSWV